MKSERLDTLLVERGLARSRQEAQSIIMSGSVMANGARADKSGVRHPVDAVITVAGQRCRFVSRGGLKLEGALDSFGIEVAGKTAVDVGASTGGFTDCLLQRGASKVVCVDVGYGQLAEKIRTDQRVTVIDRFNARNIRPADLPFIPDLAVIDVSFISLRLILPPLGLCLSEGAEIVPLVKPQFEVGKGHVGKGGIVRDGTIRIRAVEGIEAFAAENGMPVMGRITSPIEGRDGNIEYLLHLRKISMPQPLPGDRLSVL